MSLWEGGAAKWWHGAMGEKKRVKQAQERNLPEFDLREAVLEKLLELHVDFSRLGRLESAGPLLYQLMEYAYYALPPTRLPVGEDSKARKETPKSPLN